MIFGWVGIDAVLPEETRAADHAPDAAVVKYSIVSGRRPAPARSSSPWMATP
jgi:hypothetical protein